MKTEKTVSHTKGSWVAEGKKVTSPDQRQYICDAAPHSADKTEEAFANARLIAAAPEMLKALQGIAELKELTQGHAGKYQAVINAIKKAKGI